MAMRRAAARSGEWALHFKNASCLTELSTVNNPGEKTTTQMGNV